MGRVIFPSANKGSQRHLQYLVNESSDSFTSSIQQLLNFDTDESLVWKSPLASDDYAEYYDGDFLKRVGLPAESTASPLTDFWAARGPRWDGLAYTSKQRIILIEAKAHLNEMTSTCAARSEASRQKIQKALDETKAYLKCQTQNDWLTGYYQYANRLAYLYWLRILNGINAHLVFVYFVNDSQMRGPESVDAWEAGLALIHAYLGLNTATPLSDYIHSLFIDVSTGNV